MKKILPTLCGDIYYHCEAKKCNNCKVPLVFKISNYTKNTNKNAMVVVLTVLRKRKRKKQEKNATEFI